MSAPRPEGGWTEDNYPSEWSQLVFGLRANSQAGWGLSDVEAIEAEWTNGEDEPSFVWLLKLRDGRYVAASGGHDYTGWDCQSSLASSIHSTREDAIRFGLTLNDRDCLGLLLPGEAIERPTPEVPRG